MCILPAVIIGGIVGCLFCGNSNNNCHNNRRNNCRNNERSNCRCNECRCSEERRFRC